MPDIAISSGLPGIRKPIGISQRDIMPSITLTSEYITLAQALKVASVVGSGGEAKNLVRSGAALVNGAIETQPGRKLHVGDRFRIDGSTEEWTIS